MIIEGEHSYDEYESRDTHESDPEGKLVDTQSHLINCAGGDDE